jgi:hypothetical protein
MCLQRHWTEPSCTRLNQHQQRTELISKFRVYGVYKPVVGPTRACDGDLEARNPHLWTMPRTLDDDGWCNRAHFWWSLRENEMAPKPLRGRRHLISPFNPN